MQAPIPGNEAARLESLYQLNILDTLPQSDYDEIVQLASDICDVPIALISLVDRERQWFKARVGLDLEQTSRTLSFCAHAILKPSQVMVVPDTLADERFCDNAVVTGAPYIRFYAGAPLVMDDGMALGTLCVLDTTPRELTAKQRAALSTLARNVVNILELRRLTGEQATQQAILYNILHQLTQETDIHSILQKALLSIRQLNRWDAISISLPTEDCDSWETRVAYPTHKERFDTYPIISGVIGRAYRTGETQIVPDTKVDPDFFQGESVKLASSEVAIPIQFDQHVLGVLNIDAYRPHAFTKEDVQFAQSIAEVIAIALNNALQLVSLQEEIAQRRVVEAELAAANRSLTESEAHFRTLANSGDALIWTTNQNRECDYVNQIWLDFSGRSLEAELGYSWFEGVHPDDKDRCQQIFTEAETRRERYSIDYRLRRYDGEYRLIQEHGTPRFNQTGEFVGYIGHCLDITERMQAEYEICFLSNLLARVTQALIVIELEGTIRYWNRSAEGIIGWSAEEVLGKKIADVIDSPSTHNVLQEIETIVSQGKPWTGELMIYRRDGEVFPAFIMVTPYRDAVGNIEGVICVFVDLSQRKQMEEAARINEIRFSTIFHQSPVAVAITDLHTNRLTDVNDAWLNAWGYTMEEVLGRTALDIGLWATPQDRERLMEELRKANYVADFETAFCRKSGEKRDVLLYAGRIDLHGVPTMLIQILDITERKQAAQNLAESEANYRHAIISAGATPYKLDYATREYTFGLGMRSRDFGDAYIHLPNSLVGGTYTNTIVLFRLKNVSVEEAVKVVRQSGSGNNYWQAEHCIKMPNGEERWILDSATQIWDENNRAVGSIGILQDITERKRTEIELQITKSRLQHLLTSSPVVIYSTSPASDCGVTFVSANVHRLTGYSADEFLHTPGFWLNHIHPEDVGLVIAVLTNFPASGNNSYEYRFRHKEGHYIWIHDETVLIRNADGEPLELIGCMLFIDQRKHAEAALNEERAFRQAIEDSLVSGISAIDMSGMLLYTNPSFCKMVGWTAEEMVGQQVPFCYWPPEEYEAIFKIFYSIFDSKVPTQEFEMVLMRRNGERFPVNLLLSPLYNEDKQIGWLGNVIDITERKAQDRLLRAEQARFKKLFDLAPHAIVIVNSAGHMEMANPALLQMLAIGDDLSDGVNFFEFISPEYRLFCIQCLEDILANQGPSIKRTELTVINRHGERIPVELDAGLIPWNDGYAAQIIIRSIIDRKRAELLEIEHRHIAYELHDGLAQMVAAAHQHLQAYAYHHRPRSQSGRKELTQIVNIVQDSAKEVRRVLAGLRPTALDDFGLVMALRLQVQALEAQGWEITYEAPTFNSRLMPETETVLFRIAQEALNNVDKHAQSKHVRLSLAVADNCCRLEIQDWGRGFDSAKIFTDPLSIQCFGLRGMQDRLALVGGHLTIQSSPGTGTRVIAQVPCQIKED